MTQPNFVFILTDTQATNVVGAYGHPELHTPNIDRLARTGVKFERAYTTCPVCTPARAAMFTGLYAHTAGPWTNNIALGVNIETMGQRFQDNGYRTGYIGKWHLDGHDYFGTGQCPSGWDPAYWYDGRNHLDTFSEDERRLWRYGLNTLDDLKTHPITAEFTWAHRVSDRVIRFLETRDDRPFVLVASYDEPHHPFTCPPEYVERFKDYVYPLGPAGTDTLDGKPPHQKEWARSYASSGSYTSPQNWVHMYLGCNSFVDAEIGRVIDAAHALAPDETYIIFTSDHGEMLGAHRLWSKGPVMYEEITHIPLIIEPPHGLSEGSANSTLASHVDLLPTMLELAGLPIPPILEGQSLVPLLNGALEARDIVLEFNRYEIEHDSWGGFQPVRSIMRGDVKLVVNLLSSDELYNLRADPAELHNLIDDPVYAPIRDELHDRLLDWMNAKRDPFRGPCWERRPWRETRRLQWRGAFRPRPADGYAPSVLDYGTGLPAQ